MLDRQSQIREIKHVHQAKGLLLTPYCAHAIRILKCDDDMHPGGYPPEVPSDNISVDNG